MNTIGAFGCFIQRGGIYLEYLHIIYIGSVNPVYITD